ncbi:right-handed parallel beta-helix repeat-containing protein, partial [Candidatus Pelagibacter sp.]|nr:right-handed parallel beta-helix repeat-containing protein [Candidatus Pelagibacter sp.]
NKVHAEGSINRPIIFKEFDKDKKWGAIAIHGLKSKGSIFKNIIIDGGTGDTVNGINYFASLSIHSTEDIDFKNVVIKNNHDYDDMVHIIYSNNLSFQELHILNSYRDAIDIDISKNIYFKNSKIFKSGNDGFDLMESTVTLDNIFISSAVDKGISVGEGSKLNLYNSTIENSNYGLASKDSSKVNIYNSLFKDNKIQLSTYKKNWRYGESGSIEMKISKISSKKDNLIIGDKSGSIKILSTDISGKLKKKGNVTYVN